MFDVSVYDPKAGFDMEIEMTFDKLFASRPVNKQTALANSGGYTYTPKLPKQSKTTQTRPALLPVPKNCKKDFTGHKIGRLTVVGYGGRHKVKKISQWVVRCVCGNFEYRRTQRINDVDNLADRCSECRAISRLKLSDYKNRFGEEKGFQLFKEELVKEDAQMRQSNNGD